MFPNRGSTCERFLMVKWLSFPTVESANIFKNIATIVFAQFQTGVCVRYEFTAHPKPFATFVLATVATPSRAPRLQCAMPTAMLFDEAMAKEIASVVSTWASAGAALRCRNAPDGERILVQYDCTDIYKGNMQREQLQASFALLRDLVPVVTGKACHQKTMEIAVEQVSKDLELNMDTKSIERQAYKLRAMLSHLLRMKRETRKYGDKDELYLLSQKMLSAPSKGTSRKTAQETKAQSSARVSILKRVVAKASAGSFGTPESEKPKPSTTIVEPSPSMAAAAKRLRITKKSPPPASLTAPLSHSAERISAPPSMSPQKLHPLLEAAEAQLAAPTSVTVMRKPAAASVISSRKRALGVAKVGKWVKIGGWQVQKVLRSTGGSYSQWWSPSGKRYRSEKDAQKAGFVAQ